jgi:beta-galactosidase
MIHLGASYYPPHHPGDLERDVAAMAAAGMTCIRSAELLASWDFIEKVRDQPDWSWLDALFEAAYDNGMQILLGTGSPSPPIWLRHRYPDVQILDREGRPFPTGTVWGWACRNHPGYREELYRYLSILLERYADHPALWAWQIDNEPGFPFIHRHGESELRLYDYNPYTVELFRRWLQDRYGDLDTLNVAWRWDCTHHQYSDWSHIDAPRSMPKEWGVVTAWLDWRTFLNENMAAFVRWQHNIIREFDQQHPTMTNIFAFSGREVEMALDPWLMARQVDVIGYDLYPGINRRFEKQPEFISMFLDMGRSTALAAGVEFWAPELESGPISGWAMGPDYTTRAEDIIRYNLECLGHGARAILYQGYREWPCIPIHWGALADFNGKPTTRYYAAQQINEMVREHSALFSVAEPPQPRVLIYHDTRNATLMHGMGAQDLMMRCLRGAYSAFWEAGWPVGFIDSTTLLASDGNINGEVLVLSAAFMLDAATVEALRELVNNGLTLICFAKCAWVDDQGWSWADQPGAGIADLCGVEAGEIEVSAECEVLSFELLQSTPVSFQNAALKTQNSKLGYHHLQPLTPTGEAELIARFNNGQGAIVRRSLGAGETYYVGTHLDAAALEDHSARELLRMLAQKAAPAAGVLATPLPAGITAHPLNSDKVMLLLLVNDSHAGATVQLNKPGEVRDLLTGEVFSGEVPILARGGRVLQL